MLAEAKISQGKQVFIEEVRVKKIWTVLVPYFASFLPVALLLWWGWKKQRVVRLALPQECPKGKDPISMGDDLRFIVFGVARDRVLRYCVETLEIEYEMQYKPTRVRVVFSGGDAHDSGRYRKATVAVWGMLEDCLGWDRRIAALLKVKATEEKRRRNSAPKSA